MYGAKSSSIEIRLSLKKRSTAAITDIDSDDHIASCGKTVSIALVYAVRKVEITPINTKRNQQHEKNASNRLDRFSYLRHLPSDSKQKVMILF